MVNSHGIRWFVESIAPIKGLFFSICYVHPRCNIKYNIMSNQLKKLELVNEMLTLSNRYGLTAEVVLTAINLAKDNPEASVAAIMLQAVDTWDCFPEIETCDDLPF